MRKQGQVKQRRLGLPLPSPLDEHEGGQRDQTQMKATGTGEIDQVQLKPPIVSGAVAIPSRSADLYQSEDQGAQSGGSRARHRGGPGRARRAGPLSRAPRQALRPELSARSGC